MARLRTYWLGAVFVSFAALALGVFTIAGAQDTDERSALIGWVEQQISTPDMQIRLGAIDGVLSSDVTIASITISDKEGPWLTLENVHLVWSRLKLLAGTLDIDLLEADRITLTRVGASAAPGETAGDAPFEIPEIPVEIVIDKLSVPAVEIGAAVFGQPAELSVDGNFNLSGGSLETRLEIERRDAPGSLTLEAAYGNESRELALKVALSEPEDGVVANLLALEGKPSVDFIIEGSGPLDNFAAEVSLAANGQVLFGGPATISSVPDGLRFLADLTGSVEGLVAPAFRDYFGSRSRIGIDATRRDDGSFSLAALDLRTGVLGLTATGELTSDFFPTRLQLEGRLGAPGGDRVPLPGLAAASVDSARLTASLGVLPDNRWTAEFELDDFRSALLNAGSARIVANGVAENMTDPAARHVTFALEAVASQLGADDPAVADALGPEIRFDATGEWSAGGPVIIKDSRVDNGTNWARFLGTIGSDIVDGTYLVTAADLSLFAGIAGRDLGGAVDLRAMGQVALSGEAFNLHLDTTVRDIETGIAEMDGLLKGETTLRGGAALSKGTFRFAELNIENRRLRAVLDGSYGEAAASLVATGRIADVAALTERASGAADFRANVSGPASDRAVQLVVEGDGLRLMDRPFADAVARVDGRLAGDDMRADVVLSGNLGGVPVRASAALENLADGTRALRDLVASAGQTRASGDIALGPAGLMEGALRIDAPELSVIAPLLLAEASGALTADITLRAEGGAQSAVIDATARNARYDSYRAESADIDITASDIFGAPAANGRIDATGVEIGRFRLNSLAATATREGDTTRFDARAGLANGDLATAGLLRPDGEGFVLRLETLSLASPLGDVSLAAPTEVTVDNGRFGFDDLDLAVADGRIRLNGGVGETLDLRADVNNVPLSVANAVAPYLEARGRVTGVVNATGSLENPSGTFDLNGRGISAEPLERYGITDLDIDAKGSFDDGTADLVATTIVSGGRVNVEGRIGRELDLRAEFRQLPLALANAVAPDLALAGQLTGSVTATGTLDAPNARFQVEGSGISAAPLREAGLDGLAIQASGTYANDRVILDQANISGDGIRATARGTVPLDGRGLDLTVTGDVPLSITDRFLIDQGTRLSGTLRVDVRITGSLARPNIDGTVSGAGIALADPGSGVSIRNISVAATFNGDQVTINQLTGNLGRGTISANGTVTISPAAGYPVNLAIALRNARYEDGKLVVATLSGDLTLQGALTGSAVLGGTIRVERAEISVPESLPASSTMLDVVHRNAPPAVLATLRRAGIGASGRGPRGAGGSSLALNVNVVAPARVFVRGRGLDVELGGQMTLTGTVNDIRPVGSFQMRRGRLDILGKRITFTRGRVTLVGDLDPNLDFLATTRGDTVTVNIIVSGSASDPEVTFTSTPELPQDEVLSQLLFGRGIDQLSPLQLLQLGAAAAQLAGGGGGGGVLDQLRAGTGLDNLDVTTDSDGNVAVEAGRYVSENVYLGVKGGEQSSGVTINLDITDGLTARAEATQRDSKLGIFYEREY